RQGLHHGVDEPGRHGRDRRGPCVRCGGGRSSRHADHRERDRGTGTRVGAATRRRRAREARGVRPRQPDPGTTDRGRSGMNGIAGQGIGAWLEALASDAPTPGGGAFAGLSAAAGAALIAMVGNLTAGKEKFADVDARMRELIAHADAAREEFLRLADKDATAFDGVMAAFKMPKETDLEK